MMVVVVMVIVVLSLVAGRRRYVLTGAGHDGRRWRLHEFVVLSLTTLTNVMCYRRASNVAVIATAACDRLVRQRRWRTEGAYRVRLEEWPYLILRTETSQIYYRSVA